MPPKRNERGKKNRKAKANGSATSQQPTTVVSKRSPPTRKAKAKAGRAVKKTVASALTNNNNKPLVSVGKRKPRKPDPIFFTADSGIQYRVGDYAYVDAERPDLPYHICRIRDLKTTRKEHVVADVTWFYRPSEVPESIYLHLLDDQQDEYGDVFKDKRIRERQLFISLSCLDLRPLEASLFRGKCEVFQLTKETQLDLETLFETQDQFFYSLAYNQESRQFTFVGKEEDGYSPPYIPLSQQAQLPELRDLPAQIEENSQLVWEPKIDDEQLLTCLRAARSIALHAGLWINGNVQDGYLAASSDQTTQNVFDTLHKQEYESDKVLKDLVKKPTAQNIISKKQWSNDESKLFAQGVRQYGKHFSRIQKEYLPNKNICEMIEFYYHWKKSPAGLDTRTIRKQKKQHHIKMAKQYYISQQDSGQEFADLCSAEEDEGSEETERDMSYYVCTHCYTKESPSWHHAGPKKCLLCDNCRLYYNKYGEMRPLKEQTDSPDSNYKGYFQVPQPTGSKAKQGTKKSPSPERGGPTLRSGRVCKPSDTSEESTEPEDDYEESGEDEDTQDMNDEQEDNEESDCSEESYLNTRPLLPIKRQSGHTSLLVHLRDKETDAMNTDPSFKRAKPDMMSSHSTEELGQNSNNQASQMSSSPAASADVVSDHQDTLNNPSSSHLAPDTLQDDIPLDLSRFARVSTGEDDDFGCARTNIMYIMPKPKSNVESEGSGTLSSTSKAAKTPQTPLASTPSMQHTPLISVYTPTMGLTPTTPFVYPSVVPAGDIYNREQAAAMGLPFQRPVSLLEQERMAEFQRMMYHKQQQQHGMQIEGHMMSPAMAQHPYFQSMVMTYPEMFAAAAGGSTNEEVLRQQRMMAAAAASQVAQPHTPTPDLNHFQFDPRVLMQYGAMCGTAHNQEEMYMIIRSMELRLVQFTQQIMMHQPSMLQPEFANELQKHYEMFRYLLIQNPNNQHNPMYHQIWQVLEHFMQQKAAMEQHPAVRTGVIVNSTH